MVSDYAKYSEIYTLDSGHRAKGSGHRAQGSLTRGLSDEETK